MSTRNIKDAKDLNSGELIYFKGHAKATYMSDGTTVEDAINNIDAGSGTASNDYWDKGEYENLIVTNNDVEINGNLSLNHSKELNASLISCSAFHNSIDDCYLVYDKSGILLEDGNTDEIFSVTNTGDGTKFLSNDGSYKSVGKEVVLKKPENMGGIRFNENFNTTLEPNKIYIYEESLLDSGGIVIDPNVVVPPTGNYGEYTIYFSLSAFSEDLFYVDVPDSWEWANDVNPIDILRTCKHFELSVCASKLDDKFIYKAVLTGFGYNDLQSGTNPA